MTRAILPLILLAMFVAGATSAAMVGKGADGKTYLTLDEDEVELLGIRMQAMATEIAELQTQVNARTKIECDLI